MAQAAEKAVKRICSNQEAELPNPKRVKIEDQSTMVETNGTGSFELITDPLSSTSETPATASNTVLPTASAYAAVDHNMPSMSTEEGLALPTNGGNVATDSIGELQDEIVLQSSTKSCAKQLAIPQESRRNVEFSEDYQRAVANSLETFQEDLGRRQLTAESSVIDTADVRVYVDRGSSPLTGFPAMHESEKYDEAGRLILRTMDINRMTVHKAFTSRGQLVENDSCKANLFLEVGKLRGDIGDEMAAAIRGKKVLHWKILATTETQFNHEKGSEDVFVSFWVSRLATPAYIDNQDYFGPQEMYFSKAMVDCFGNDIPVQFHPANMSDCEDQSVSQAMSISADEDDDCNIEDDSMRLPLSPDSSQLEGQSCEHEEQTQRLTPDLPMPTEIFLQRDAPFFFCPAINTVDFAKEHSVDEIILDKTVQDGAAAVFRANIGRYDKNKMGSTRALKRFVADTLGLAAIHFNDK